MVGAKSLTNDQKVLILFMIARDDSIKDIMRDERLKRDDKERRNNEPFISEKCVRFWLKRFKDHNTIQSMKPTGRPRKLTKYQENKLISTIEKDGFKNYKEVKDECNLDHISRRTANNYAIRNGYSEYFKKQIIEI